MDNSLSAKELEEILLDMKLVTDEDILTATIISLNNDIPVETVLIHLGIITIEQLKQALKVQYGIDAVTEEQISSLSEDVMNVLPEDFIKMYKVIPIICEGEKLVVAMVNPNDKQAILNIITYMEMEPTILVITHYEFQKLVKKYYNENRERKIIRLVNIKRKEIGKN